jgi:hypothetical protein
LPCRLIKTAIKNKQGIRVGERTQAEGCKRERVSSDVCFLEEKSRIGSFDRSGEGMKD